MADELSQRPAVPAPQDVEAAIDALFEPVPVASPDWQGALRRDAPLLVPAACAIVAWFWVAPALSSPLSLNARQVVACSAFFLLVATFVYVGRHVLEAVSMVVLVMASVAAVAGAHELGTDPAASGSLKILAAVLAGTYLARLVEWLWTVVILSFAAALVDLWSVASTSGVTSTILRAHGGDSSQVFLSILLPVIGAPLVGPGQWAWTLGMTDVGFIAFAVVVATEWRLRPGLTVIAIWLGATLISFDRGGIPMLPILVPCLLAANWAPLRQSVWRAARG